VNLHHPTAIDKRLLLLSDISSLLSSSLEFEIFLKDLTRFLVSSFCDWCSVYLLNDESVLDHVGGCHRDLFKNERLAEWTTLFPPRRSDGFGPVQAMRTGLPEVLQIDSVKKSPLLRELACCSVFYLPLRSRDELLGVMAFGNTSMRPAFTRNDILLGEEIATRTSMAITNSRLFRKAQQASEELKMAKGQADLANQAKSQFLANMSHEIRTPLGAILGFAELLQSPEMSSEEKAEWIDKIQANGSHLLRLIDQVLDISKVESGKIELELQPTYLAEVIDQIHAVVLPRAQSKRIRLKFKVQNPVPSRIRADRTRLQQILINVIGNAVKFTEKGEVTVTAGWDGRLLSFVVEDTGPGLTPEQKHKIFSPFSQGDISHTRRFGGTGLGLVLSRNLARLMGGDVVLEYSEPKRGCRFKITIDPGDVKNVSMISSFAETADAHALSQQWKPSESIHGCKVLLVEDSPDNEMLLRTLLTGAGADVEVAHDGVEGVEAGLKNEFDLILMDIQMPNKDGYAATAELRACGVTKPIVALTAHALKEEKDRAMKIGFNGYLTKPISRRALLEEVARHASLSH